MGVATTCQGICGASDFISFKQRRLLLTMWTVSSDLGEGQARGKPSPVKMVTVQELASILHVHPNTVRHWSDERLLKSYRIGPRGDRRFSWEDIRSFLNHRGKSMSPANQHKGRVLIVDDDYRVRSVVMDVAQEQGCEVVLVESGKRALEELEKRDFDLIFVDLVLSGLAGLDVLKAIKANVNGALVAVVTGYSDDPIAFDAMSVGPLVLVRKPLDVADVIGIVNLAMSAKRCQAIPT